PQPLAHHIQLDLAVLFVVIETELFPFTLLVITVPICYLTGLPNGRGLDSDNTLGSEQRN
ncbi:unnamed protein product, partial [Ilex paraguariensis]